MLAVVLLVLVGPKLIDTPAVRAEIQRRLAEAIQGEVTWQALEVQVLPAPHAALTGLKIRVPDQLQAEAEALDVYLRLWPLLRGEAQVSSVTLKRPALRLLAKAEGKAEPLDPLKAYRAVVEPAARALQDFAPDMTLRIERGAFDRLRDINLSVRTSARGAELEFDLASDLWQRLAGSARLEYADLSARGHATVEALRLDPDLPPAAVRADLRTDGNAVMEAEFDASLGNLGQAKGRFAHPANKLSAQVSAVPLDQAIAIARRKLGTLAAIEGADGMLSADVEADLHAAWKVRATITRSDAAIKLAALPWKVSVSAGEVLASGKQVNVRAARGRIGDSSFDAAAAQIELGAMPRLSAASGKARVELKQWFAWLKTKAPLDGVTALDGSADIALERLALRFDKPQDAVYEAIATLGKVSAVLEMLPAPLSVTGGSVHATPAQVRLDGIAGAMLDARATFSGIIDPRKKSLEISITNGATGEKAVAWAMQRHELPARFEPRTPLIFSAPRIAWGPKQPLEVEARVEVERGPALGVSFAVKDHVVDVRRITLKDASSDAVISARIAPELIEASFAGTLHERSIAALRRAPAPGGAGVASGELLVSMDRAEPRNSVSQGRLRIQALDLSWLAGRRAVIENVELAADKAGIRVAEASVDWEEQRFRLRGEVRRGGDYPVIDAVLESPGVDLKRLLPPRQPGEKSAEPWPLPVRGSIAVRSAFVDFERHRVAPFDGVLTLEPEKARLQVKQATVCGVSFPMEVEARPQHAQLDIRLAMDQQPFEKTLRCLTGGTVVITGDASLRAELHVEGRRPHLLRNLTGTAELVLREGRVSRFALLGNILSVRNIADVGRMNEEGFPYRTMRAKGRFQNGAFLVDEGAFDSSAVHLATTGRVDMMGANSRLTVLVGLLTTVDRIAGAIPIVGDIFGGSLTALPVSVSGDIRDPLVLPLGPGAVSERLLDILGNTAKLPGKLFVPEGTK